MTSRTRLTTLTLAFCSLIATIALGFEVHGAIAQKWQSLGGVVRRQGPGDEARLFARAANE